MIGKLSAALCDTRHIMNAAGLGIALLALSSCEHKTETAAPAAPPDVEVTKAREEIVPLTKEWVATLDGSKNVQVKARIQGYLQKQFYNDGSIVEAGDPLFIIDPRPFEAALQQARATLANERAKQQKSELAMQRSIQLFASKTISTEDRDNAVADNNSAKAAVLAAAAAVDEARINLEYTTVTAIISGIAGISGPGIGDLVGPSTEDLTSISTLDPIKAKFQISEKEYLKVADVIGAMTTGTKNGSGKYSGKFYLVLASGDLHPYEGTLSTVDRQFDVRTGTIQVEALFPNPGNILRPGFFARFRAVRTPKEPQVTVPQRAIIDVQGTKMVAVVGAGNKVEIRRVVCGQENGSDWVIESGLKAGETVVVEGVQKAKNGDLVSPRDWATTGTQEAGKASDGTSAGSKAEASHSGSGAH